MSDPIDIGPDETVERVALDISLADFDLYRRFAAYRNALASAQKKSLKRKWTRKSLLESILKTEADRLRAQLEEMVAELGPLPDPDDADALTKYVKRVLAWDKKLNE